MTTWLEFAQQAPELAEFGRSRFKSGVAYLATLRPDGGPRVHPVTPILGDQLFLFMEPASPKGQDLRRDGRYMLHCAVEDSNGGAGEFYVRGRAALSTDRLVRERAARASSYVPSERYILFVLAIELAFKNSYIEGQPNVTRWTAAK
jgi:hypothetical protein